MGSYEICFFLVDTFSQLVQVAITNVNTSTFSYTEDFMIVSPTVLPGGHFQMSAPSSQNQAYGGNGVDYLQSMVGPYNLNVSLVSTKDPAIHYNGLAHPYSFGGYTYYYSRTHMTTTGSLTFNGDLYSITGTSWFDRQYGDLAKACLQGWQWFAIELDDNSQVMLFDFLGTGDDPTIDINAEKYGSITDAQGVTVDLAPDDFTVTATSHWTSPSTGCTYPNSWSVTFKGQSYSITPKVINQEVSCNNHRVLKDALVTCMNMCML